MSVYGIVQLTITDQASYDHYAAAFMPILRQHNGTLLIADDNPRVVEGGWDSHKIVVASFEDEAHFDRWYTSPDYQAILGDRLAGSHGPLLLVRGIPARA